MTNLPKEVHPLLMELMTLYEPDEAMWLLSVACEDHAVKIAATDVTAAKRWAKLSERLEIMANKIEDDPTFLSREIESKDL